ncbi:MAG: DUF3035 domain-containing protein [Rhodospirillales bacterium]|nr:MAG: DUF3035 domain-containing protein [Rhodospirillales bacterium]
MGALSLLGACSAFELIGGGKKTSPDEFKIVSHTPLTMPPSADLRPPTPGAPRPMETTPTAQAREIVTTGGREGRKPAPAARGGGAAEAALLAKSSASGSAADPEIRNRVNRESRVIADSNKSFINSLIFWQEEPQPGVLLDPAKEQQRLREAQASGAPPKSDAPVIERRRRGILEGIF